jgi:hypothetical protein
MQEKAAGAFLVWSRHTWNKLLVLVSGNIEFIVTRNLRGYRQSLLPVVCTEEMVGRLGPKI